MPTACSSEKKNQKNNPENTKIIGITDALDNENASCSARAKNSLEGPSSDYTLLILGALSLFGEVPKLCLQRRNYVR